MEGTAVVSDSGTVAIRGRLAQSVASLLRHTELVEKWEYGRIELHFSPQRVVFQIVPVLHVDVSPDVLGEHIFPELRARKK